MRLINVESYELEEFVEPQKSYAILSHTWGEGEVSFHDMTDLPTAKTKRGWQKIEKSCKLARGMSLEYVWVDTCCIDKRSSAELTEAINSIYRLYQKGICIAFLKDLPDHPDQVYDSSRDSKAELLKFLASCRWFSRGWTLQELIAPKELVFYDRNWKSRGTKHDLSDELSQLTGIDPPILIEQQDLSEIPVARQMSWAALRRTTRVEDLAYCLLGIFDVNMALIYGEGEKAFIRLQEAIAHSTDDFSLFTWSCEDLDSRSQEYRGMFAKSPAEFSRCRRVEPFRDPLLYSRQSFTMTNRGMQFQALLRPRREEGDYLMNLLCQDLGSPYSSEGVIAICLKKGPKGFARHKTSHLIWVKGPEGVARHKPGHSIWFGGEGETHYRTLWHEEAVNEFEAPKDLTRNQSSELSAQMRDSFRFRVKGLRCSQFSISTGARTPIQCWDPLTKAFFTGGFEKFTGLLQLNLRAGLKAIISPLIVSEPIFLLFGLVTLEEDQQEISRGDTHNRVVRPWVALYCNSSLEIPGQRILIESHGPSFIQLADVWEEAEVWKNSASDYADELSATRTAIFEDIAKGYSPPTTLAIDQDPALDLKAPKQLLIKVTLDNNAQRKGDTHNVSVQIDIKDPPCQLSEDSNL